MKKPKSIFLLSPASRDSIYNEAVLDEIGKLTDNDRRVHSGEDVLNHPEDYRDVEIVFSGWGCPIMDEQMLASLPSLKALFYGAGSVRRLVTDAFWERNIRLTSAYTVNAHPVAAYTMASLIFGLKRAWGVNQDLKRGISSHANIIGLDEGTRVGLVSLGAIGRLVCQYLSVFSLDVVAYDPFAGDEVFEELSVRRASSLEELFSECHAVSIHTPLLPETRGMITGELLEMLPPNAVFINTSRGAVVDEEALTRVLEKRPDIFAVLDVITDEEAYCQTPLLKLPNVFLTPHIAGSLGNERYRLGRMTVEECRRYLAGEPPVVSVTKENFTRMA
ncbi:hydroxyacid dehydrogenase [Ruficoccus amylovorans]|uniref:Hydroxyacid dehydrogenase n=1 Tax=Ruficoccus amylovorans TaxID=1804625 RepID=A0A842HGK6_9BACT|nr:hydroxyacid dehydrogenase [Ruficoccus amylovorans]MBC2595310.1 hydroxyacid dehydrogenase [Ruficoccus amylovorans]